MLFALGLISVLSITVWVYYPGLEGPLVLDDFNNLSPLGEFGGVSNLETFQSFVFGNGSGPTGRPVSMLSFLLDAQDWPAETAQFKYTNLMIHLLCGLVFCWLAYLIARSLGADEQSAAITGLITAALWLVHPMNVSTTLYIVQRMTQLMTLFAGLSLVFYLKGRQRIDDKTGNPVTPLILSLFPFGLLAVLSKENGALLLLLIVIMEQVLFRGRQRSFFFSLWYRAGVIGALSITVVYLLYSLPETFEIYQFREFSLLERVLTQTRILSTYIWKIFFPDPLLGSLFHDSYVVSTSLLSPITTLLATAFIVALLAAAFLLRRRAPVLSFAIFWFFAMHIIESTVIPLELYFEHRNYLPIFAPLFGASWYFVKLLRLKGAIPAKISATVFASGLLVLSSGLTWSLTRVWSDETLFYQHMTEQRPDSARAQTVYAEHLESIGDLEKALEQIYTMREYYPNEVIVLLNLWNFACRYNLQQPMSIAEIASLPNLKFSFGNINYHFENFLENFNQQRCQRPEHDAVVSLFSRVLEMGLPPARKARLHYHFSNYFMGIAEPESALSELDNAIRLNQSVTLKLRQTVIAGLLGQYDRALEFAAQARALDAQRDTLLPSRESDISTVERLIREQM
jgi:tetratricopeptide (TPR) repeat protein